MRYEVMSLAGVAALLIAGPAAAEPGQYAGALKKMLSETAAGNCPADLMGDRLLAACKEQLPRMRTALVAEGPIKKMTFATAVGQGEERIETYDVTFTKGTTAKWQIGIFQNGKFQVTYSNG